MNSEQPLVSIITPCYNGEKVVSRLIESVLNQTYPKIEFIIVNDGSTDKSEEVILSYEHKFKDKGYIFKYVKQENKGLGGAINTGLKHFTGEFLCWPDADDYLELNSVEDRVKYLLDHPDFGVVTSNAYHRKSDNLDEYKLFVGPNNIHVYEENQFDLLLNGQGPFCPGCHMARVSMFLDVNPNRSIYPARRGQNWQLLLPLYYKYKRGYLNKPLYNYIDYPVSMSKDNSFEDIFFRFDEHENIILKTLCMIEEIQNVKLDREKDFIIRKYNNERIRTSLEYHNKKMFFKHYYIKKNRFGLEKNDKVNYLKFKFGYFALKRNLSRIKSRIKCKIMI